jgi:hypothetical protein
MRLRFLQTLVLFFALLGTESCVESYEPGLNLNADVLTVDGTLTDGPEQQLVRISLTRTQPRRNPEVLPVPDARVSVLVDGTTTVFFSGTSEPGVYGSPSGFRGRVGSRYQLRIETTDGQQYDSSEETMVAAPPIDGLRAAFDPLALPDPTDAREPQPGHRLYLNTTDPAGTRNYYRWEWTLWEKQPWCATCRQGILEARLDPVTGRTLSQYCEERYWYPADQYYDYLCQDDCWDLVFNSEIRVGSDAFGDGLPLVNNPVGVIPLYQATGCLVEVRQIALTQQAHEFYQLLQTQAQTTGTLADTPPAPPIGNIRNRTNPERLVAGYFAVGAARAQRLFIDRADIGATKPIIEGILGHVVIPEPYIPPPPGPGSEPRPPYAICAPSLTRTPVKPLGWQP